MRALIVGFVAVVGFATPAFAADICPKVEKDKWLSKDAISAKAKELGYEVKLVQPEDGCWEVKGNDKAGKRVEVYFHPATAEIVKVKN